MASHDLTRKWNELVDSLGGTRDPDAVLETSMMRLFILVRSKISVTHDVDEVVNETIVEAIAAFDPSRLAKFDTFAASIAVRKISDYYRRRSRRNREQPTSELPPIADEAPGPERTAIARIDLKSRLAELASITSKRTHPALAQLVRAMTDEDTGSPKVLGESMNVSPSRVNKLKHSLRNLPWRERS